jgi:prepilin-type N-terminal cleavage/methylation domain-containing protein
MSLRGFTLLEIMIALGLLLSVVSLAIPTFVRLLGSTTFEETASQLESVLVMARADAQRDARAIRLVAYTRESGMVVLYTEPLESDTASGVGFEQPVDASAPDERIVDDVSFRAPGVSPGRLRLRLPEGYRIDTAPPPPAGVGPSVARGDASAAFAPMETLDAMLVPGVGEETRSVTLGIFLPDGSVIAGSARYLVGSDGQGLELRINRWTGSAMFVAVEPETEEPGETPEDRANPRDPGEPGPLETERADGGAP